MGTRSSPLLRHRQSSLDQEPDSHVINPSLTPMLLAAGRQRSEKAQGCSASRTTLQKDQVSSETSKKALRGGNWCFRSSYSVELVSFSRVIVFARVCSVA